MWGKSHLEQNPAGQSDGALQVNNEPDGSFQKDKLSKIVAYAESSVSDPGMMQEGSGMREKQLEKVRDQARWFIEVVESISSFNSRLT